MKDLDRRAILAGLAAAGLGSGIPRLARAEGVLPADAGLNAHAKRAGMTFGSAIAGEGFGEPEARALYEAEVGLITTDIELKFAALRPSRDVFRFGPADAIVDWARAKRLMVRGHTLIWNEWNGDWINRCSAAEIARIFDEHIERTVSHFAGRIAIWDVINEPFWPDHGEPGGYRKGPWYDALGPGYIRRALERVRAIDPHVKLCINEAHCPLENSWGKGIRPCLSRLITELRHDGVPLDIVGLQAHVQPQWPHDHANFAAFLRELAGKAVDLHITEFDVNDVSFPDSVDERDLMVADFATDFLDAILPVPALKMLITWELADRLSFYEHDFIDKHPGAVRLPRVLPFDDVNQRKPLWTAIAAAFDKRAGV